MNRRTFLASSAAAVVARKLVTPAVVATNIARESVYPIRNCLLSVNTRYGLQVAGPAEQVIDYLIRCGVARINVDTQCFEVDEVDTLSVGELPKGMELVAHMRYKVAAPWPARYSVPFPSLTVKVLNGSSEPSRS